MAQYIKYYWTDNLGNYQTVANQSVDRRHPHIEGGSTKYWLKDERGVDYCLCVCPDTTLIDIPPVGIEIITKSQWDEIVASIPPAPEPPEPPKPNWETFRSSIATSQELQAILNEVVKKDPYVVVRLTSAAYKLDSGEFYDFKMAWGNIMSIAGSITEEDPNTLEDPNTMDPYYMMNYFRPIFNLEEFNKTIAELAKSCNLPQDFVNIFAA